MTPTSVSMSRWTMVWRSLLLQPIALWTFVPRPSSRHQAALLSADLTLPCPGIPFVARNSHLAIRG